VAQALIKRSFLLQQKFWRLIYPVGCDCLFRFDILSIATNDVYISVYSVG
jgi:hypothetical protein